MNWEVFVTCAVTGAGDTTGKSAKVPVTPKQIAEAAIEAAKAGAAIAHIHVATRRRAKGHATQALRRGGRSRALVFVDVILNLTAGMGGDLVFGGARSRSGRCQGHRHGRGDGTPRACRAVPDERFARSIAAR